MAGFAAMSCLAGCAVNPATHRPQLVLTTQAQEREAGHETAEQIETSIGTIRDEKLATYVAEIGSRVAAETPESDFVYEFRVLDVAEPNAFALPGGYVFVTRGMLALTSSEDELAAVLAHEVGHVAARHSSNQLSLQAPMRIVTGIGALATTIVSPTLGDAVADAGGAAADAVFAPFSRQQEGEADQLAQEFTSAAGWDPAGMSWALASLQRHAEREGGSGDDEGGFLSSHPATPERVEDTRERASELAAASSASRTSDRRAFLAHLDGLIVGPDPRHGVFVGTKFVHPELAFSVRFPEGWRTANGLRTVGARSRDGSSVVTVTIAGEGDDPMAVARTFADGADGALALEKRPVGDLSAVRGVAHGESPDGESELDLAWIAYRGLVFQITAVSPITPSGVERAEVMRAVESFHALTPGERPPLHADRLRIATAREGETVIDVARRSGSLWDPRDTAVLNDVEPNVPLVEGTPVKVVLRERY